MCVGFWLLFGVFYIHVFVMVWLLCLSCRCVICVVCGLIAEICSVLFHYFRCYMVVRLFGVACLILFCLVCGVLVCCVDVLSCVVCVVRGVCYCGVSSWCWSVWYDMFMCLVCLLCRGLLWFGLCWCA